MLGISFQCLARISDARKLFEQGRVRECVNLLDGIRNCHAQCAEMHACTAALRILDRSLEVAQ